MTDASAAGSIVTQGKPVTDPAEIERELVRIWRDAASLDTKLDPSADAAGGEPAPRMRAVLSNLVLLTGSTSGKDGTDALITELCITHPARFFVVRLTPDQPEAAGAPLQTGVSSRCVLANSGSHVCSEEVYVTSQFRSAALLPNLLTSLVVADVPVTLVMLCDPSALVDEKWGADVRKAGEEAVRKFLAGVSKLCNRLIYDSAMFGDYSRDLDDLISFGRLSTVDLETGQPGASVVVDGRYSAVLRDVNWQRLKRWRTLIAEQFSNTRFRDVAGKITRLEIRYSVSGTQAPGAAFLLASWFAHCLEWKDIGEPRIVLKRVSAAAATSEIEGVTISIADDQPTEILIEFSPADRAFTISCMVGNDSVVRRAQRFEEPFEKLILTDIVSGRGDEDFARVLIQSLDFSRRLKGTGNRP